ncbi:unnamed protein product [Meloidogyne enterolobii]|uniref:Uncharacterized protein n=1 Tax=Meloidogyne enterolobii TaxID=390850 RepID=A0ACB0XLG3_MELEN
MSNVIIKNIFFIFLIIFCSSQVFVKIHPINVFLSSSFFCLSNLSHNSLLPLVFK